MHVFQGVAPWHTNLTYILILGVILETKGSVRKIQKRALFHYKTVKKGTPNLISRYLYGLFTIVLTKQIFEKTKSSRATSASQTQFKPEINREYPELILRRLYLNW